MAPNALALSIQEMSYVRVPLRFSRDSVRRNCDFTPQLLPLHREDQRAAMGLRRMIRRSRR